MKFHKMTLGIQIRTILKSTPRSRRNERENKPGIEPWRSIQAIAESPMVGSGLI